MTETTICPLCRQPLSATALERERLHREWVRRLDAKAILFVATVVAAVVIPIALLEWLT